uniref:Uncharacterized protein n=1 Tax=Xiphophorus couchianus TaxID=32473 RepID=A0A3B5M5M3_9TELE
CLFSRPESTRWPPLHCASSGSNLCPRSLDCARAGRHFCRQGSSHCGPCLYPLVEDHHGRCVDMRRHLHHSAQALDEEIDILSGIISEQRSESKIFGPSSSPCVSVPPSQDMKAEQLIRPISKHRGSPTDQPTRLSITLSTTSAPSTTNCSPGRLGEPRITAYPPNDQVFLSKSLLPGDQKLAHSAQMYHYQHQKQQMLSLQQHRDELRPPDTGTSTDEENDGDFTVYECPGLAPTGEMEVKNPLFDDANLYLHRFHK